MSRPPDGWSAAEQDLWRAVADGGAWPNCGGLVGDGAGCESADAAPSAEVRADALSYLLLSPPAPSPGRVPRVHLNGVKITGVLSLQDANVDLPVSFIGCRFDNPINLAHTTARSLDFTGSQLPQLDADDLKVIGDLTLAQVCGGRVGLFGADIGGNLWLTDATLTATGTEYALNCPQLRVGGGLYGGKHSGEGLRAVGGINAWGASIGFSMELNGAQVTRHSGFALRGHGLKVGHDLSCAEAKMPKGGITLFSAIIGGQLWLNGGEITANDGEYAITAPMLDVKGGVYATGLTARGGINLFSATVGESVDLGEATLVGESRHALRAPGSTVQGDLACQSARIMGRVDLSRSDIGGRIRLAGTTFESSDLATVDLSKAKVGTLSMAEVVQPPAAMDLHDATLRVIEDELDKTPDRLDLDGLAYESLRPSHPVRHRLQWLSRGNDNLPQPYEQLALLYRRLGHDQDARTVLLARHRAQRKHLTPAGQAWGLLEEATTGYGYRPMRALAWFLALVTAVAAVFVANPPARTNAAARTFNPVAYALDLVLPVLDLGQERAYLPSGWTQWVTWAATLVGWLLATAIIAGITRRITRS